MAKQSITYGNITDGNLSLVDRDKFVDSFRGWPDCQIELTVKQLEPRRSDPANRYYWGAIVPIARAVINQEWQDQLTKEQVHNILKENNNLVEHETPSGRTIMIVRDTHDMPHSEFCQYVERCRMWLLEFFGCDTPDPQKMLTTKTGLKV